MASEVRIGKNRLIPAPVVQVSKQLLFTEDGRNIGSQYNLSLQGTILPGRGSPRTDGWHTGADYPLNESFTNDTDKFNAILIKQELIKEAFNEPGTKFSYTPPGGLDEFYCYPAVESIEFDSGTWVIKSDYTINLTAPTLNQENTDVTEFETLDANATGLILRAASDNFSVRELGEGESTYEISRTVQATALHAWTEVSGTRSTLGNSEAWKNAKTWVDARLATPLVNASGDVRGFVPSGIAGGTGVYYNFIEEEQVNKYDGSYSVTQTYLYAPRNYRETRNVNITTARPIVGGGTPAVINITVNGAITGFDIDNDPSGKLTNAETYWNSIASGIGAIYGATGPATNLTLDKDISQGTINYTANYTKPSGSQTYTHIYDVSYQIGDDNRPSLTIAGTVEGITNDGLYAASGGNKFNLATSGWRSVTGSLDNLAVSRMSSIFGIAASPFNITYPASRTVSYNEAQGTINYSWTYNNVFGEDDYSNDFNVSFQTENANTAGQSLGMTATIQGTIKGLGAEGNASGLFDNAQTGWAAVKPTLYARVSGYMTEVAASPVPLLNQPVQSTVSLNPWDGTIGYNYSYSNKQVASGEIAVIDIKADETYPSDIFAIQKIPGRAIGPILQNLGSLNERKRNVAISMTMFPKSGNQRWAYSDIDTVKGYSDELNVALPTGVLGSGYFVESDTANWDWINGFFTRNLTYVLASSGR